MGGWATEIRIFSLLLLFTLIGGWIQGSLLLAFAQSCLGTVLWLLWRLRGMLRVLEAGGSLPEYNSGLLHAISSHINRLQDDVVRQERYNTQVVSLFRDAFEAFPDAVIILDPKWRILWCNSTGKMVFGLDEDVDNHGSLVEEVGHPVLEEYLTSGDYSVPLELESPADWSRVVSIRVVRLPDSGNLLILARDITRHYHIDQMRRDFVANVSHELKTPLTVIGGYLESMHGVGGLPDHWQRPVELMHQQSDRMRGIVDDLLLISRLEQGHDEFIPVEIDVAELLQTAVANVKVLAKESGHIIELGADQELKLLGERKILESMFYNIIVNAVQHTRNGSSIDISWRYESGRGVFEVVDSGDGIPARHLPHLTEPFYRVDAGRSRDSGGTGLGLSIVKRSLDRHKAELKITSETGKGTVFRCEFQSDLVRVITNEKNKKNMSSDSSNDSDE